MIKIKTDHALAWHYAGICHEKLGNAEKAEAYAEKYREYAQLPFWRKYIEMFDLPVPATA